MTPPTRTAPPRLGLAIAAILLAPMLVVWHQSNALYPAPWLADTWFYLQYFRNLLEAKRDLFHGFYYGSRLAWILPGAAVHSLLPPLAANAVLHLVVQSTATLSLFTILRLTVGIRSALPATLVFSAHPWLWAATGSDYVDGPGIAYALLAMALLTSAALRPVGRLGLAGAGAAIAGMVYTQLFTVVLAAVIPFTYVALARAWHRRSPARACLDLAAWAGAGFAAVTILLCGVNWVLDGHYWFYAPSIAQARGMAKQFPLLRPVRVAGQLAPWLWPAAAACVAALLLAPREWRARRWATLLFAAQLLAATAAMAWLQSRGTTVLGHYCYASFLLPLVFLFCGAAFWPACEALSERAWWALCGAIALALAAAWHNPDAVRPSWATAWLAVSLGLLAAALLLRRHSALPLLGPALAGAGFCWLTALALSQSVHMNGTDVHASRAQYERIMHAWQSIEAARGTGPMRFWFNRQDPGFLDYFAIHSLYLAEASRLSEAYPGGCEAPVSPGTLIAVMGHDSGTPATARQALERCWRPFGLRPTAVSSERIAGPGGTYTLALVRAARDEPRWHPLRVDFDGAGRGSLQPDAGIAPVPLPVDRWVIDPYPQDRATLTPVTGGLRLRTPGHQFWFAAHYAPLIAPADGSYYFSLRGRERHGQLAFGARPGDDSTYLAADVNGHRAGDRHEFSFWLRLRRSEMVLLRTANNDMVGYGPATFLMEELTVYQVPAL